MVTLLGGIIALVIGIILLISWFLEFIDVIQGTLPVLLILGGILAAYLGAEEIKDKSSSGTSNDERDELKNQVESLKEEIKGLKEEKKAFSKTKKE